MHVLNSCRMTRYQGRGNTLISLCSLAPCSGYHMSHQEFQGRQDQRPIPRPGLGLPKPRAQDKEESRLPRNILPLFWWQDSILSSLSLGNHTHGNPSRTWPVAPYFGCPWDLAERPPSLPPLSTLTSNHPSLTLQEASVIFTHHLALASVPGGPSLLNTMLLPPPEASSWLLPALWPALAERGTAVLGRQQARLPRQAAAHTLPLRLVFLLSGLIFHD